MGLAIGCSGLMGLLGTLLALMSVVPALAEEVQSTHAKLALISDRDWAVAGKEVTAAIRFELDPGWHLYWLNPGDNGQAPSFSWQLPVGWKLGVTQAPRPEKIRTGALLNFGHSGSTPATGGNPRLYYLTRIKIPSAAAVDSVASIRVKAKWLICKDVCIPGRTQLELRLPVKASGTQELAGASTSEIEAAWLQVPKATAALRPVAARLKMGAVGGEGDARGRLLEVEFRLDSGPEGQAIRSALRRSPEKIAFYPVISDFFEPRAHQKVVHSGDQILVQGIPSPELTSILPRYQKGVPGVLEIGSWSAFVGDPGDVEVGLSQEEASGASDETRSKESATTGSAGFSKIRTQGSDPQERGKSKVAADGSGTLVLLLGAIVGAFFGGILLNLMPCVFPVLSLKALEFVGGASSHPASLRRQGMLYLGGVLSTFLGLATALQLLRYGGEKVGWGFQLQSSGFVAFLGLLLFFMGLHTMGVFEFGGAWMGIGSQWTRNRGGFSTWLSGMLAVVVATPCTAPFMGTALGFAMTLPYFQSLGIFLSLGLGLASPYVALSFFPGWSRILPRPGRWLETFKQCMAFPLWATVLWLVWVVGLQKGTGAVVVFLEGCLGIGLGAWMWGRWSQSIESARATTKGKPLYWPKYFGIFLVLLATAVTVLRTVSLPVSGRSQGSENVASQSAEVSTEPSLKVWHAYRRSQVEQWIREGRAVFIDFTAAWCVTCQANHLAVLGRSEIEGFFETQQILRVKADWTNEDPEITTALEAFGRNGVPLYVFYPKAAPGSGSPPEAKILPQILTPKILKDALTQ